MTILVFDATVVSHFARAGHLESLHRITSGSRCVMPAEVMKELLAGAPEYPALARVVTADWIEVVDVEDVQEIVQFARYKSEFGGGSDRNIGEAAVLAWAASHMATAIVDDAVASRAARRDGIDVHGTLWLLVIGIRSGVLDRGEAERIVDDLAATEMRLPVDGPGLFAWAYEEGWLS